MGERTEERSDCRQLEYLGQSQLSVQRSGIKQSITTEDQEMFSRVNISILIFISATFESFIDVSHNQLAVLFPSFLQHRTVISRTSL